MLFRYAYIVFYPLNLAPDEALYWEYSRRLDISYYSKPPLIAYLIAFSVSIFGNSELGVRFFSPLFGFLVSIIAYKFCVELFKNKNLGLLYILFLNLSPAFCVNSVLMTIDAPFIFFYTLSLWFMYKAITQDTLKYWIALSLFSSLAFLSKYTAFFLLLTPLFFNIHIVKKKNFWIFAILFSLSFTPILYWNWINDWVGFKHLLFLGGLKEKEILNLSYFFEFLGGQALILGIIPFYFLLIGWLKSKNFEEKFLRASTAPVFLFFLLMSLHTKVEANWSAFPYPIGSILAFKHMKTRWKIGTLLILLVLFIGIHFYLPPEIDPKKRLAGWKELGKEVSKLHNDKTFIITPSYQISAELAFYVKNNPYTYSINLGRRMNDYDLWKENLPLEKGKDGIFVTEYALDERVRKAFENIETVKELEIKYRGKIVRKFKIYKLKNFKGYIEEEKPLGY